MPSPSPRTPSPRRSQSCSPRGRRRHSSRSSSSRRQCSPPRHRTPTVQRQPLSPAIQILQPQQQQPQHPAPAPQPWIQQAPAPVQPWQQYQAPPQFQPPPDEVTQQLSQLTQAIHSMVNVQRQQLGAPAPAPQTPPPEQGDPNFDWTRLYQPPATAFPPATIGQIQQLAAGLLAKLPALTGRDHHKVAFLLSMAWDYPQLPANLANSLYQRMNLLYIAIFHGWHTAIQASGTAGASAAIFPPGFAPAPYTRRPLQQQQTVPPETTRTTAAPRGRGGGRRRR